MTKRIDVLITAAMPDLVNVFVSMLLSIMDVFATDLRAGGHQI